MDEHRRAETAATLREIAVLVGAIAKERLELHEGCVDPDCTPGSVFEEFNGIMDVAVDLEELAAMWEHHGATAHPNEEQKERLEATRVVQLRALEEQLRKVAMGEADA